ncbi:MAG TPA: hypothetical protein VMZ53_20505 [Kofleriaceae bacterium]|nr:hypothetical protein [Kofleriaceae bacterium]
MRRVAAVALLLIACGDDDSGSGEYVSVADFDTAYKDAECTYLVRCGLFPDQATCTSAALFAGGAYSLSPDVRAEIAAGRVLYNGNAVHACFDAIANATCDKTDEIGRAPISACYTFTRGTLAADAPCLTDAECISQDCRALVADGLCEMGACNGDTPPSLELPINGEPCNRIVGCGRGSYCDSSTDVCTPLKIAGADCVDTRECGFGLGCAGAPRTCKTLPGPNEACPDGVCRDEGLHCGGAVCKALGLVGATCSSSTDCSPYFPCDFATTMCKRPPSLGEACASSNSRCFDEKSYCDGATLKCVAAKPDGSACSTSLQCESGNCDFNTSTCVTQSCSG